MCFVLHLAPQRTDAKHSARQRTRAREFDAMQSAHRAAVSHRRTIEAAMAKELASPTASKTARQQQQQQQQQGQAGAGGSPRAHQNAADAERIAERRRMQKLLDDLAR